MRQCIVIFLFLGFGELAFAAQQAELELQAKDVESRVFGLREEIDDLELSVRSLDELHDQLTQEMLSYEKKFRQSLQEVSMPLLQWPRKSFTTRMRSWIELQRTNLVVDAVQKRLTHKPLALMAQREVRLKRLEGLRDELREELESLHSKEDLLGLQLKEIQELKEETREFPPQASGKTKKLIGDIEGKQENNR